MSFPSPIKAFEDKLQRESMDPGIPAFAGMTQDRTGMTQYGNGNDSLIVPVRGRQGAVSVMLHAAQSALIAASEIRKLDETVLSRFARKDSNGIWSVQESYLNQAQSELRAAFAVAIAA